MMFNVSAVNGNLRPGRVPDQGAILVESLLVISMFVLIFVGLGYVQAIYQGQLRLIRATRAASMAYANDACEGDPISQLADDEARTLSPPQDRQQAGSLVPNGKSGGDPGADEAVGKATQRSGLTLPRETSATANLAVKGPLSDPSQPGGSFGATLTTANHVLCGDKNRVSGPLGIAQLAFDFLLMK